MSTVLNFIQNIHVLRTLLRTDEWVLSRVLVTKDAGLDRSIDLLDSH
jgi:hypothetical protein